MIMLLDFLIKFLIILKLIPIVMITKLLLIKLVLEIMNTLKLVLNLIFLLEVLLI